MIKTKATSETTVAEALKAALKGASNSTLKKYLRFGRITVNGKTVHSSSEKVNTGDEVCATLGEKKEKVRLPFKLIYEDEFLVVADKEPGMLSSGEGIMRKPTLHKLVDQYVMKQTNGKHHAWPVHRLDKEVTGLIVFARSEAIQQELKDNWSTYTKRYLALVEAEPPQPEGTIDTYLCEVKQKMIVCKPTDPNALHAVSQYRLVRKVGRYFLVEVQLKTGKKNQIRAHLSHIGCPIVGDRKYGADDSVKRQVRLMAYRLDLVHPRTKEKLCWDLSPTNRFLTPSSMDESY
jgi:23S rRNA pseudouridine1911/1915/1917 synthase